MAQREKNHALQLAETRGLLRAGKCCILRLSTRENTRAMQHITLGDGLEVMNRRTKFTFLALVLAQAAHSVEEYTFRLYEVFAPARFVSGLISNDRRIGFITFNIALFGFGLWCYLFPVRRGAVSAVGFIWVWIVIEFVNGVGHPLWSVVQQSYTPGVATAPVLLLLSLYLGWQVSHDSLRH